MAAKTDIMAIRRNARSVRPRALRAALIGMSAALTLSLCAILPLEGAAMAAPRPVTTGGGADGCGSAGDVSCKLVQLDDAHWRQLQQVQESLRQVHQISDKREFHRAEYWQVAQKAGDCEDIALAGRQRLLALGWPTASVRLATAWTEDGDYHTVLTIDGIRDGNLITYVLDNRFPTIVAWHKLEMIGYRFHIRQAAQGPYWVTIQS
jgi:predicted transglutaminase-like cysteine proteinase